MNGWPVVVWKTRLTSRNAAVDGAQDPLRHVRRAGDEQEISAGHRGCPRIRRSKTRREPLALAHHIGEKLFSTPCGATTQTGRGYLPGSGGGAHTSHPLQCDSVSPKYSSSMRRRQRRVAT